MIGGYKIINFDGNSLALGGVAVTITGIFDHIGKSQKATLIENLTITIDGASIRLRPFFAEFIPAENMVTASVLGGQAIMSITDADAVTLVAAE